MRVKGDVKKRKARIFLRGGNEPYPGKKKKRGNGTLTVHGGGGSTRIGRPLLTPVREIVPHYSQGKGERRPRSYLSSGTVPKNSQGGGGLPFSFQGGASADVPRQGKRGGEKEEEWLDSKRKKKKKKKNRPKKKINRKISFHPLQ